MKFFWGTIFQLFSSINLLITWLSDVDTFNFIIFQLIKLYVVVQDHEKKIYYTSWTWTYFNGIQRLASEHQTYSTSTTSNEIFQSWWWSLFLDWFFCAHCISIILNIQILKEKNNGRKQVHKKSFRGILQQPNSDWLPYLNMKYNFLWFSSHGKGSHSQYLLTVYINR